MFGCARDYTVSKQPRHRLVRQTAWTGSAPTLPSCSGGEREASGQPRRPEDTRPEDTGCGHGVPPGRPPAASSSWARTKLRGTPSLGGAARCDASQSAATPRAEGLRGRPHAAGLLSPVPESVVCCEEEEQLAAQQSEVPRQAAGACEGLGACSVLFSVPCCFSPPACAGSGCCKAWMERELQKDPSKLTLVQSLSECAGCQQEQAQRKTQRVLGNPKGGPGTARAAPASSPGAKRSVG